MKPDKVPNPPEPTLPIDPADFDRINQLLWLTPRLDMPQCLLAAQCRYYAGRAADGKVPYALSRQLDAAIERIQKCLK